MTKTRILQARKLNLLSVLEREPHESVAHVKVCALRYMEAAEGALAEGGLLRALHLIGIAEGIAEALAAVTGVVAAPHEGAIRQKVGRRSAEIRAMVARRHPESASTPAEHDE